MASRILEKLAYWDSAYPQVRLGRVIIGIITALYILVGYTLVSQFNVDRFIINSESTIDILITLDNYIPVIPEFVWPYFLYIPCMIIPAISRINFHQIIQISSMYLIGSTIAWICFIIIPLRVTLPEVDCMSLSCAALEGLRQTDPGVNLLPSLHVTHTVIAFAILYKNGNKYWPLMLILVGSIIASTLFTKQHYLLDIPAGFLNAFISWHLGHYLVNRFAPNQ